MTLAIPPVVIPPFKPGDRLECRSTTRDHPPITPGEHGTVLGADNMADLYGPFPFPCWLVYVRWDEGRTLSLCLPPDKAAPITDPKPFGLLLRADGTEDKVFPADDTWTLEELYKILDCELIETVRYGDAERMVFDERGKLLTPPKPYNERATSLLQAIGAIRDDDYIVGDALITSRRSMGEA